MDLKFLLKQFLPLKYEAIMNVVHEGKTFGKFKVTWRMWGFHPFHFKTDVIE